MELVLTDPHPCHANFCTRDGQVIYKVSCPFGVVDRTITIDKITALSSSNSQLSDAHIPTAEGSGEPRLAMDSFTPLARIDYAAFVPMNSKFHFFDDHNPVIKHSSQGKEQSKSETGEEAELVEGKVRMIKADEMFKKGKILGGSWYGSDRIFVGPDRRQYVWVLGLTKPAVSFFASSFCPSATLRVGLCCVTFVL